MQLFKNWINYIKHPFDVTREHQHNQRQRGYTVPGRREPSKFYIHLAFFLRAFSKSLCEGQGVKGGTQAERSGLIGVRRQRSEFGAAKEVRRQSSRGNYRGVKNSANTCLSNCPMAGNNKARLRKNLARREQVGA